MDETDTWLEDDQDDLAEFVNELDQDEDDNDEDDNDEDDNDEDEDVIEVETLDKLAEIERQLGLVPRQPADEQEVDRGTDG
jgi:hypothetical protein